MPKADRAVITETLGVEPVMFDASLVSAQSRKRLFWTNIPFSLPDDRGILLKDILQPDAEVDESMTVKGKSFCLTASYHKVGDTEKEADHNRKRKQRTMVKLGHLNDADSQGNRVYSSEGKSATLSANGGGLGAKTGLYAIGSLIGRRLDDDGHRQDGNHEYPLERRLEIRSDDKSGALTSVLKDNLVIGESRIRKLTPVECERLQGLPDDYTAGIPKTHRYKCLGNAFCVPVVAHILRGIADAEHSSLAVAE